MRGPSAAEIEATILRLVAARGPGRTVCPSEIARALAPDEAGWRALMPRVREVAARLRADGRLRVTQQGRDVDPEQAAGPIRLGAGQSPRRCRSASSAGSAKPKSTW